MTPLAYEHNGRLVGREAFYAIACDPRRSVAVEACAGAGKTWMLVSRILRALLAGASPSEILAITFTRKAAGEMRQRLHDWLAQFADFTDEQLAEELRQRGMQPATQAVHALKGLQGALLAQGRPVQIRTFHSWFAALLRNAPLAVLEQLGLPASHELLEDDSEAVDLMWRRFHSTVVRDRALRADFDASVAMHGRSQTRKALEAALGRRVEFALADERGRVETSVRPFAVQFPAFAGLPSPVHSLEVDRARERWLARAAVLGAEKNKTPRDAAAAVVTAFETADVEERFKQLRKAFFVADDDRLTAHLSKFAAARDAEAELQALCQAQAQHEAWLHHQRMTRLTRCLISEFAALKRERGWVDMNDVETTARVMLSDAVLSGWVQERLDAGIRHLLIDEFQDTNPLQWQALHAWLSGYAGAGGDRPSVFIVGDPKQSIYRFRRAEPQVFKAAQRFVVESLEGDLLSCDHTHRNSPEVLVAVNAVMTQAQQDGEFDGFRVHTTESTVTGEVECLPQIARPPRAERAAPASPADEIEWRDSLAVPREQPEEKLAVLECRQAARWISQLIAGGAAPRDIMVLSRRRERLGLLQDELRALHIPSQQPEQAQLGDAPEVQDVVALLDVLVSPTHDLSLARALKSPLFGLGDDALVALAAAVRQSRAAGQPTTWFELLQQPERLPAGLQAIGDSLCRWSRLLDTLPPHDALDAIFREADVVARFAAASPAPLRGNVVAHLRALLGAALQVDGGRYATPYAFVRALKAGGLAAPVLSSTDAVRLLTVHGAKGLEADHVLMLDCDGAPPRAETMGVIIDWPGEEEAPVRFAFIASEKNPPPCNADALQVEQAARRREELNALYVAMTRARHHLVISSVEPLNPNGVSWWQRLQPLSRPLEAPGEAPPRDAGTYATFELPQLPPLTVPAVGRTAARSARTPDAEESRFGQALHRLLERTADGAGGFTPQRLRGVAREFMLSDAQASEAAAMAARILGGEGAWAWDRSQVDWQANEVPLHHEGELLRLDRLVRRSIGGEWWVLDYKSAAQPQAQPELVDQMRRYRRAVEAANPGAAVRAAFLTGQGKLLEVE